MDLDFAIASSIVLKSRPFQEHLKLSFSVVADNSITKELDQFDWSNLFTPYTSTFNNASENEYSND